MAANNEIIIQVKNVTKAYGNKEAVKNARLSLTIGSEGLGKAAKDLGNAVKGLFGK